MNFIVQKWFYLYFLLAISIICDCFNFEDLKAINGSCSGRGSCGSGRNNRLDLSLDWKEVNCFCDDACVEYGDCCLEAKVLKMDAMEVAPLKYQCIDVEPFGSYYMKGKCKEGWTSQDVAELCQKASPNTSTFNIDPFLDMPVTSLRSDVTYKNYYCAVCNDENLDDLEVWHAQLSCPESVNVDQTFIERNLQYVNNSWGVFVNNSAGSDSTFYICDVYPTIKETITHKIRRCIDYLGNCADTWTDSNVEKLCHSYTTVVYGPPPKLSEKNLEHDLASLFSSTAYRNYHCAVCNFIKVSTLTCYERDFRQAPFAPVSFSVLFDFGKNEKCEGGNIWDPFSKLCRPVVCLDQNTEFRQGRCVKIFDQVTIDSTSEVIPVYDETQNETESDEETNSKMKCDKLFLNESEFQRGENGTIKVNIYRRTYDEDEYETYKDGILVCIPNSYTRLMGWLTLFGLGLSCICILVHITTFTIVSELRNLSGKNLVSMCIALLVAYVCFLVTTFKETGTEACPVLGSIMYYSFLASFTWMNVMAFDIWRTLEMATSELRLSSGKQWKKFVFYSIYAWTFPLLALAFVSILDHWKPNWIDPTYLPELGKRLCWFGQRKAILVYFASPLAVIMLLNIAFFVMAVKMVALTTRSTSAMVTSQDHQVQLKLYLRLALLMGLSWISGIIAGYIQNDYVWYLFILLNAFQGLYILMAFTCTNKVRKALRGTSSVTSSYGKKKRNSSIKRLGLESQDSNHSHLSNTSTTNLTSVTTLTSKSSDTTLPVSP